MDWKEASEVLGVAPGTDAKAVRRAYLKLLKRHKPEVDPEGFQRLRAAFECLELGVPVVVGPADDMTRPETVHDSDAPPRSLDETPGADEDGAKLVVSNDAPAWPAPLPTAAPPDDGVARFWGAFDAEIERTDGALGVQNVYSLSETHLDGIDGGAMILAEALAEIGEMDEASEVARRAADDGDANALDALLRWRSQEFSPTEWALMEKRHGAAAVALAQGHLADDSLLERALEGLRDAGTAYDFVDFALVGLQVIAEGQQRRGFTWLRRLISTARETHLDAQFAEALGPASYLALREFVSMERLSPLEIGALAEPIHSMAVEPAIESPRRVQAKHLALSHPREARYLAKRLKSRKALGAAVGGALNVGLSERSGTANNSAGSGLWWLFFGVFAIVRLVGAPSCNSRPPSGGDLERVRQLEQRAAAERRVQAATAAQGALDRGEIEEAASELRRAACFRRARSSRRATDCQPVSDALDLAAAGMNYGNVSLPLHVAAPRFDDVLASTLDALHARNGGLDRELGSGGVGSEREGALIDAGTAPAETDGEIEER